jgi:hypothetical protein
MAKTGGKNPNFMVKVFCPTKRMEMWANSTTKADPCCTGCGGSHPKVTAKFDLSTLNPSKDKKKKYKKGKKQK